MGRNKCFYNKWNLILIEWFGVKAGYKVTSSWHSKLPFAGIQLEECAANSKQTCYNHTGAIQERSIIWSLGPVPLNVS